MYYHVPLITTIATITGALHDVLVCIASTTTIGALHDVLLFTTITPAGALHDGGDLT